MQRPKTTCGANPEPPEAGAGASAGAGAAVLDIAIPVTLGSRPKHGDQADGALDGFPRDACTVFRRPQLTPGRHPVQGTLDEQ